MDKNNGEIKQTPWPETKDLLYETLTHKVVEFCQELNKREKEKKEYPLAAAQKIWSELRTALSVAGRKVGLNDLAEPVMPEWAKEPVVPIGEYYGPKPKTKSEALKIALSVGYSGWVTIGDLWLWVGGGGPIVEKTLEKFGFWEKKEEK